MVVICAISAGIYKKAADVNSIENLPPFDGETPYVVINENNPAFDEDEITNKSFEEYSNLDHLGRVGTATACIGKDIMPTEERGSIGSVKPSGWHTVKYDIVDGKYLYNRCHLIGFQLTGENANEKNLATGTRFLNTEGMLPFENMVADYVKETGNHVMYRVTPYYDGDNLLASGFGIEALSVEDGGEGICFNIYAYNVQPGIEIDYKTGESSLK
ncbi:MAG: DNA/RNA non-specific endonuclease [Clostridia bacterium]|nr:DNA/RNA non-specific endonuclease [Clostridia bacterium]